MLVEAELEVGAGVLGAWDLVTVATGVLVSGAPMGAGVGSAAGSAVLVVPLPVGVVEAGVRVVASEVVELGICKVL